MRQLWVFGFVLATVIFFTVRTWTPAGTTTVDVSLPKPLVDAGVRLRLRTRKGVVDLVPGHQELETVSGESSLKLLCPRGLAETHLFRRKVAARGETVALALRCAGEVEAINCEVTSDGAVTLLDMASCNR
jgi:hypothetical protein